MIGLVGIAKKLKGDCCEHLVKYTGQEIRISGLSAGIANYKVDIGSISNEIKTINAVPPIMISLDNNQYLLCRQASNLKNDDPLKDICLRIRLMLILAISQLQNILSIPTQSQEPNSEIIVWIRQMNELTKQCIDILRPEIKTTPKSILSQYDLESGRKPTPKYPLSKNWDARNSKIMKYQGITEEEMVQAIDVLKEK